MNIMTAQPLLAAPSVVDSTAATITHRVTTDSRGWFCLDCSWPQADFTSRYSDAMAHQESTVAVHDGSVLRVAEKVVDRAGVVWTRFAGAMTNYGSWNAPGLGWRDYHELDLPGAL